MRITCAPNSTKLRLHTWDGGDNGIDELADNALILAEDDWKNNHADPKIRAELDYRYTGPTGGGNKDSFAIQKCLAHFQTWLGKNYRAEAVHEEEKEYAHHSCYIGWDKRIVDKYSGVNIDHHGLIEGDSYIEFERKEDLEAFMSKYSSVKQIDWSQFDV